MADNRHPAHLVQFHASGDECPVCETGALVLVHGVMTCRDCLAVFADEPEREFDKYERDDAEENTNWEHRED